MANYTYRIELKLDCDEDRHEAIIQVAKQYARDLMASAMLVANTQRQPMIALFTENVFIGEEEINVLDPSDDLHQ